MMESIRSRSVYISGPLQSSPNLTEARDLYESIAAACTDAGWEPYLPHQWSDPELHAKLTTKEVFRRDMHALLQAEILIAVIGQPSSGAGAEIGIAHSRGVPVIGIWKKGEHPSRFVLGLLRDCANCHTLEYTNRSDCPIEVARLLRAVSRGEEQRGVKRAEEAIADPSEE